MLNAKTLPTFNTCTGMRNITEQSNKQMCRVDI